MLKMLLTASTETGFLSSSNTPPRNIFLHMRLLLFKYIPFSRRVLPGFNHQCAIRGPFIPALFPLTIHKVTCKVKSDLNVWYLDDGCIGEDPWTMLSNASLVRDKLSSIDLEINNPKCELLITNHTNSKKSQTNNIFQEFYPSQFQTPNNDSHEDPLWIRNLHLEAVLCNTIENLELNKPHQSFFILKICLSSPNSYTTTCGVVPHALSIKINWRRLSLP